MNDDWRATSFDRLASLLRNLNRYAVTALCVAMAVACLVLIACTEALGQMSRIVVGGLLLATLLALHAREIVRSIRMRRHFSTGLAAARNRASRYRVARDKMLASQAKYKMLFESSSDAIMLLRPGGTFYGGNRAAVTMFGLTDEAELISRSPSDVSPEYQPDGELSTEKAAKMIDVAGQQGSHYFEWRHRRRDGTEFPANVLLTKVEIDGRVMVQATVRDVTEQKRAEEALRASEGLYRLLVQNVDVGITSMDSDYSIVSINDAQCRMFGKRPEDFYGKKCYREFEKRDAPCSHCPGTKAMTSGQRTSVETTGIRDDGATFTARVSACPRYRRRRPNDGVHRVG